MENINITDTVKTKNKCVKCGNSEWTLCYIEEFLWEDKCTKYGHKFSVGDYITAGPIKW